jgi:hypothetical protein
MTLQIVIDEKTGLEIAYIVNEDGTTLSMLKADYDRLQAEQSTPLGTDNE